MKQILNINEISFGEISAKDISIEFECSSEELECLCNEYRETAINMVNILDKAGVL